MARDCLRHRGQTEVGYERENGEHMVGKDSEHAEVPDGLEGDVGRVRALDWLGDLQRRPRYRARRRKIPQIHVSDQNEWLRNQMMMKIGRAHV